MRVMWDPYRKINLYYNSDLEGSTMQEPRPDLDPLRYQLQTVATFLHTAENNHYSIDKNVIMPLVDWQHLALALHDLANCARRTL